MAHVNFCFLGGGLLGGQDNLLWPTMRNDTAGFAEVFKVHNSKGSTSYMQATVKVNEISQNAYASSVKKFINNGEEDQR